MAEQVTVEKYQKLLAAYQELKAKNSILKKAVLDSQNGKSDAPAHLHTVVPAQHEDEGLKARLRETEMRLRQSQSEVDSLSLHNSQLTRRVETLQEELEKKKGSGIGTVAAAVVPGFLRGSGSKKEQLRQQEALEVLDEEFQRKLEDNARLHTRLADLEAKYRDDTAALRDKVDLYMNQAREQSLALEKAVQSERELKRLFADERDSLLRTLQEKELAFSSLERELDAATQSAHQLRKELDAKVAQWEAMYHSKVLFDDTRIHAFNALNVPVGVADMEERVTEIVGESVTVVKEFVALFSSFLSYMEERVRHVGAALGVDGGVSEGLSQHLNDRSRVLKPFERTYCGFHESGSKDLAPFAAEATRLSQYLTELAALNERFSVCENGSSQLTPALKTTNTSAQRSFSSLCAGFSHLSNTLSSLADPASSSAAFPRHLHALIAVLRDILSNFKAFSSNFSSKTSLEHRLPFTSPLIKDTDTCVSSTLTKLTACVSKCVNFMEVNVDTLSGAGFATRGVIASPLAPK